MRVDEVIRSLNESVVKTDLGPVFRDASLTQVLLLWKRTDDRILRGLRSGGSLFWWDALIATHDQMAGLLGIDLAEADQITMVSEGGHPLISTPSEPIAPEWERYHRDDVLFVTRSGDFVTGSHFKT